MVGLSDRRTFFWEIAYVTYVPEVKLYEYQIHFKPKQIYFPEPYQVVLEPKPNQTVIV